MFGFQPKKKRAASAEDDQAPKLGFHPEKFQKYKASKSADAAQAPQLGFPGRRSQSADQAQALNQAPDTIPGMFKPGEFVLPPDTVHALGGKEALGQVVQATHTPAPDAAVVPRGFKPRAYFANGGAPEDQSRNNSFGDAAAAASNPGVTQIPTGGLKAPAPDGSQNDPLNTDIGRNAKNAMMALPGVGGLARVASTGGAISSGINAASSGVNAASRMMALGAGAAAGPAPVQAQVAASTAAPGAQAGAGAGRGSINPPSASQQAATPSPGAANSQQVMPGVYQHGKGQYSDSAAGMGMPAGFTGQPSAQNMAAAEGLVGGFRPRSAGDAAPAQPGFGFRPGMNAPTVRHSGNDFASRKALENAATSASSIMNNGGRFDRHGKAGSPAQAAYGAMLANDMALQGAQPGMDQEAMRQNAGLQREGMQQQGATARAQMQEVGQNSRFGQTQGLAQQKFGLERETQGFQTRAAAQQEQLRNVLLDQNATPEQRRIAQRSLSALSGKTAADRMQTVALPDTTTDTGQVVRGGQALVRTLEDGTVEQVPIGGQQPGQGGAKVSSPAQLAALPSGAVYVGPDGKQYRKN